MTLLLRPVMSASFWRVWASGLLSWANWACMIWIWGNIRSKTCRNAARKQERFWNEEADSFTWSCSAVKEVRALLAGLGWLSCSVGTAPSNVMPFPKKKKKNLPLRHLTFSVTTPLHKSYKKLDRNILFKQLKVSKYFKNKTENEKICTHKTFNNFYIYIKMIFR